MSKTKKFKIGDVVQFQFLQDEVSEYIKLMNGKSGIVKESRVLAKVSRIAWFDTTLEDTWINWYCLNNLSAADPQTTNKHSIEKGAQHK